MDTHVYFVTFSGNDKNTVQGADLSNQDWVFPLHFFSSKGYNFTDRRLLSGSYAPPLRGAQI